MEAATRAAAGRDATAEIERIARSKTPHRTLPGPQDDRCIVSAPGPCLDACDAGDAAACRYAARGIVRRDSRSAVRARAAVLLERACELGDEVSCGVVADGRRADTDGERVGRIALEVLLGELAAALGVAVSALITTPGNISTNDREAIAVAATFGGLAMGPTVWGVGEGFGGDGSLLLTLLGTAAGVAASTVIVYGLADDEGDWAWTLFVLPITGSVLGYELSSGNDGYGTILGSSDVNGSGSATVDVGAPTGGPSLVGVGVGSTRAGVVVVGANGVF